MGTAARINRLYNTVIVTVPCIICCTLGFVKKNPGSVAYKTKKLLLLHTHTTVAYKNKNQLLLHTDRKPTKDNKKISAPFFLSPESSTPLFAHQHLSLSSHLHFFPINIHHFLHIYSITFFTSICCNKRKKIGRIF